MMVESNSTPLGTAFTVPVDHRSARTGHHRRRTCRHDRRDHGSQPARQSDFVRPGHLFPLVAKEGGVLRRAGHTEAAVDLARMADLAPAGVLCEILDDVGNRADREALFTLAREHRLEIISIEQLIRHRRQREKLVHRIAEADLPTKWGRFRVIAYGVKYETAAAAGARDGQPWRTCRYRSCGCTRRASRAICSTACGVTVATNSTWRST